MTSRYSTFLKSKLVTVPEVGFESDALPSCLYPFQRSIVGTALRRGRAAIFAECGLGKTPMQLSWARAVSDHSKRPVLVLAPLAVAQQTIREGEKFGIAARYATEDGDFTPEDIVITNYERLKRFDTSKFAGVVLDESSILKAYSGSTKRALVEAFASTPYRLACSATPAPNDHLELGNHSEFLSVLTSHQMIARWFLADQDAGDYRLKGHAVKDFWEWVSSWAAMCALPTDIDPAYSDAGYVLPRLNHHTHVVEVEMVDGRGDKLFRIPEMSATSVHAERRRTAKDRARKVAEIVSSEPTEPWIIWSETDYEAAELMAIMPYAVELSGGQTLEQKEQTLQAFSDGLIRVLVTKPKIAGYGLNWQHCARQCFVSATFSFEAYYQAIRRSWRFGQTREVDVHMVLGATERAVVDVLNSKRDAFAGMRDAMMTAARSRQHKQAKGGAYMPRRKMTLPSWLKTEGTHP